VTDSGSSERAEAAREQHLRRCAQRQGLALMKSRRRDPRAPDFGGYMVVEPYTNGVVAGASPWAFSLDLDQVEAVLDELSK
jgi:hypothetical protein